jgi:Cys-rich repeat protein
MGGPGLNCTRDSQCTDGGADGRCVESGGPALFCSCSYDTCVKDTDCPSGQTCACHGSAYTVGGNACVAGNCRVDSDCGAGGYCSPAYNTMSCGGLAGYYCHTPRDRCLNDSDCPGTSGPQACTYVATAAYWECQAEQLCP